MAGASMSFSANSGPYAGQVFTDSSQLPSNFWSSTSPSNPANSSQNGGFSSSSSFGMGGSLPSAIAPPNINPYQFSSDSTSYPTYLKNLGEANAQKQFQAQNNRIGMGNASQNYMHSLDSLNTNRLGYLSQAGQASLGVDQAQAGAQNDYEKLLAQLYGSQVTQRGQDVGYLGDLARANASMRSNNVMTLGGGNSQLMSLGGKGGGGGQFYGLAAQNAQDSQTSIPSSSGWGFSSGDNYTGF